MFYSCVTNIFKFLILVKNPRSLDKMRCGYAYLKLAFVVSFLAFLLCDVGYSNRGYPRLRISVVESLEALLIIGMTRISRVLLQLPVTTTWIDSNFVLGNLLESILNAPLTF